MKFPPKPRCCCPLAEPLHLNFEGNFSRLSEWLEKEPALKGSQIDLIPVFPPGMEQGGVKEHYLPLWE